jgi:thiol:disulfide interchange protein DsbD
LECLVDKTHLSHAKDPTRQYKQLHFLKANTEKSSAEAADIQKFLSTRPENITSIKTSFTKSPTEYILTTQSTLQDVFSDLKEAYFFDEEGLRIKHAAPQKFKLINNQEFSLQLNRDDNDDNSKTTLSGIIELTKNDGSLQSIIIQANETLISSSISFWLSLVFSFLGGLLLNLMPCVFPVLFIKLYFFILFSYCFFKFFSGLLSFFAFTFLIILV